MKEMNRSPSGATNREAIDMVVVTPSTSGPAICTGGENVAPPSSERARRR
jgi:hypothetical protein